MHNQQKWHERLWVRIPGKGPDAKIGVIAGLLSILGTLFTGLYFLYTEVLYPAPSDAPRPSPSVPPPVASDPGSAFQVAGIKATGNTLHINLNKSSTSFAGRAEYFICIGTSDTMEMLGEGSFNRSASARTVKIDTTAHKIIVLQHIYPENDKQFSVAQEWDTFALAPASPSKFMYGETLCSAL